MSSVIHLVRHGQSTWNEIGRIQGKQDPPLSGLGRRQVQALSYALCHEPLTAIYSSPQQRARMTAEVVAAAHELPVQELEGLAEIDHGLWEGLTEAEVQRHFAASFDVWSTRPSQTQMPGGEHCLTLQQRVLDAWREIIRQHETGHILVVSHDIPIKVIIADVLQLGLDHIGRFVVENAAISTLETDDGRLRLIRLNERCHLNRC